MAKEQSTAPRKPTQAKRTARFSLYAPEASSVIQYRFLVDGGGRDDPSGAQRVTNEFGAQNGVLEVK